MYSTVHCLYRFFSYIPNSYRLDLGTIVCYLHAFTLVLVLSCVIFIQFICLNKRLFISLRCKYYTCKI